MNWQATYTRWAHYREAVGFGYYDDWSIIDDRLIAEMIRNPIKIEHAVDDLEFAAVAVLS
jgi:hypothetical protein